MELPKRSVTLARNCLGESRFHRFSILCSLIDVARAGLDADEGFVKLNSYTVFLGSGSVTPFPYVPI